MVSMQWFSKLNQVKNSHSKLQEILKDVKDKEILSLGYDY